MLEDTLNKRENYFYVTKITTLENGTETRERISAMRFGSRKEKDEFVQNLNLKQGDQSNVRYE